MDEEISEPPAILASLRSGNDPSLSEEAKKLGWNWGGFFLPYLWLIGHGRLTLGLLLILSMGIPFVVLFHLVLYPATGIYLGMNGFEQSWREQPYHSLEQLKSREREWAIWGAALLLIWFASGVFALAFFQAAVNQALHTMESWAW